MHDLLGNCWIQRPAPSPTDRLFTVDFRRREVVGTRWLPGRTLAAVPHRLAGAGMNAELAYLGVAAFLLGGLRAG